MCISTCYWIDWPGLLGVPWSNDLQRGGCAGRECFVPLINNILKVKNSIYFIFTSPFLMSICAYVLKCTQYTSTVYYYPFIQLINKHIGVSVKSFYSWGMQSEEWRPLPQRTGCGTITDSCLWIFSKCCSPEQQILLPDLCLDQDGLGGGVTFNSQRVTSNRPGAT